MANNRTPFYLTVMIFVITLCILCQFVGSIPISVKPTRINIQSYTNGFAIIIDDQDYEKSFSDAVYKVTAKFSESNSVYNAYDDPMDKLLSDSTEFVKKTSSNAIAKFPDSNSFYDMYDSIVKFFSDSVEFVRKFVRDHILIIGITVVAIIIIFVMPTLVIALINLIGFGVTEIVKGSLAALFMASYGGKVAVISLCAILQQAGALGVNGFRGLIILILKLSKLLVSTLFRLIICS